MSARISMLVFFTCFLALWVPLFAHATQKEADAMCAPEAGMCAYGTCCDGKPQCPPPQKGVVGKPCQDHTNGGTVKGHCTAPIQCKGDSFTDQNKNAGNTAGLDQVMKALGDLLGKLMQQSGQQQQQQPQQPTQTPQNCTTYTKVSDPSLLSLNPCAQYEAPVSGSILGGNLGSSADQLLQALGGGNQTSSDLQSALDNTNSNTNTNDNGTTVGAGATSTSGSTNQTLNIVYATSTIGGGNVVTLQGGATGDIVLTNGGATVLAGTLDTQHNTEVAGFFGTETFGGQQPQGLVAQMCQGRPWASNFLSTIIPPSFFDSLCTWRGYQVGTPPAPQAQVTITQTVHTAQPAAPSATSTSAAEPSVSIWASPSSVPLGARTTIFWSTQNVSQCTETSPDGSFNQTSLSGGAATVPLTGPTTFTISCLAPDGSHATADVTVHLSI